MTTNKDWVVLPSTITPEMEAAALEVDDLYRLGRESLIQRIFDVLKRTSPPAPSIDSESNKS